MWVKSWFACIESPIGKLNERVPTFSILSQRSREKRWLRLINGLSPRRMVFVQEKRKSGNKSTALEHLLRDRPLENLWVGRGGGGGEGTGEVQKKHSPRGKLNEKKFLHAY